MDDQLYFVIFPEDGVWVAHGLQHNVVTHGQSLTEVRENIDAVVAGYEALGNGTFKKLPQAETAHWERFIRALKATGRDLDAHLEEENPGQGSFTLELRTA